MSWSRRRQALIIIVIAVVITAVILLVSTSAFYKAPSCTDGIQNRDEAGIDCGGSYCTYLCTSQIQEPVVRIQPRPLQNIGKRTDVIAYVDNTNAHAAVKNAPYTLELYGPGNKLLVKRTGTVDLPPHSTVPIFIPNILQGKTATVGFLTFDTQALHWFKSVKSPTILPISNIQVIGTDTPRITATIKNPTAHTLYHVKVIIAVFNSAGNVIAASQTIESSIPAQGTSSLVFTWNVPFTSVPAKEEVWPLLQFPGP